MLVLKLDKAEMWGIFFRPKLRGDEAEIRDIFLARPKVRGGLRSRNARN